jgi:hypothetical protein
MTPLLVAIPLLLTGCGREPAKDPAPRGSSMGNSVPPTVLPSTVNPPTFNGTRAFVFLTAQTAFGPRNPLSIGHDRCLAYLSSTLKGLADDVRLQEFAHVGYEGEKLRLTNIIASFRPAAASRVLLCAHWDTRPRAEHDENTNRRNEPILGANDGASGVAVLLEIATLLKSAPPSVGVDLVLFDGEDYGKENDHARYLLGSRYYAANLPNRPMPRFGILLDMVGDKFLDLPREQFSTRYAPDVVDLVWRTAARLGFRQFEDERGEEVLDDHIPLNEAGIKTIDIIDFNYPDPTNRFWHSHKDTPENCSAESLEAVGTVLTHVLYELVP